MAETIKTLRELTAEELKRLYMRVFNTDDGQLLLQDLRDRCFFNAPIYNEIEEGQRRVVLHIDTMLMPIERQAQMKGEIE